jgi:hypothetical protein
MSDTGVKQAFVGSLRVQRTKHPYWEMTLNIKIPKNHLKQQVDMVQEIQNIARVINTKPDSGGWWHRSYVEATQAEMFIVYWDAAEQKELSKKVGVNSAGGTSLGHDETDENIKRFFREIKLLKVGGDEKQDDDESAVLRNASRLISGRDFSGICWDNWMLLGMIPCFSQKMTSR